MHQLLFKKVDNSPLILFRIFFGSLMLIESWGAIFTGWVHSTFVKPTFLFSFIGFEFLQVLQGSFMYIHYVLMGIFGLGVALGYRYKLSSTLFFLFWSITYYMQKTEYNNHYYLIVIISFLMIFFPANAQISLDVKYKRTEAKNYHHYWIQLLLIAQVFIVYTYASFAKIYPDWLSGNFINIIFSNSAHWYEKHLNWEPFVNLLRNHQFHLFTAYSGILFDLLIFPALLWKRTRLIAFFAAIIFHIFNSITLHIGIFPYFALAFSLFFFERKNIHHKFLRRKPYFEEDKETTLPKNAKLIQAFVTIFIFIQVLLPIRHYFIKGPVLWNEAGHRLSWRMMLRSRTGSCNFYIKQNNQLEIINFSDFLSKEQINDFQSKPDMIWQFAQHLKQHYLKQAKKIEIYADCQISVNRGRWYQFTDSQVNLAEIKWNYWGTQSWILDAPKDFK